MGYISGEDRNQIQLYTTTMEELLDEDNPVRVIDAFVESLNMGELKIQHAEPASTGRPPYHPKDLLKLYIYGYFNRIRSSRRLMTECGRNIELFYLLNRTLKDGSARYQNRSACRQCPHRCTPSKNYKVVKFGANTKYVPILMYGTALNCLQKYPASEIPYNAFKLLNGRAKKNVVVHIKDDIPTQKLRLCLSEHPFGTVKWYHGAHYLLCKGIEKATAELGLSFLAYNLKRAINMVGTKRLVAAMKA